MYKKRKTLANLTITLLVLISGAAVADTKAGQAAMLKGHFAQAFKEFKEDADKGIVHAQATVAVMLHTGQGVKRDLSQAFFWYQKAAEKGHDVGLANVGIMHYKGVGTQQNDVQAYAWLDVASQIRGGREHNAKARAASFLSPTQLKTAKKLAAKYRLKYMAK
jgi:TPR repeat protein